jgi:hypothetical protein
MDKPKLLDKIKLEHIILGVILIFGLFIRVYALGVPPLWVDEAISATTSVNIIEGGVPVLDSGMLYGRAYLFHYTQAFFLLFGETDFLVRFASVIIGLLTILLAYFVGREYSKSGGVIAALFVAVFYLEVFYSRQGRFYQLFQLLFFSSLYFLYKSKNDIKYLYFSLITLILTINTQIAGLILCPFFIIHILMYNKKAKRLWAIVPTIPLVQKFLSAVGLSTGAGEGAINYASRYFDFTKNIMYLLILFIPGVVWSFIKKKRLTTLIVLPSLLLLISIFTLETFALRYSYFFVFPLVLYTSLLLSFLFEKYGNIILITIFAVLIIPSNLIFPSTGVNIIKPIDYNYNDYSAPEINYKNLDPALIAELQDPNNIAIGYFTPSLEWYVTKPDYVLQFSMDGRESSQVIRDGIDVYSGQPVLDRMLDGEEYYIVADTFSTSKLKPTQVDNLNYLTEGCEIVYESSDLKIYKCQ